MLEAKAIKVGRKLERTGNRKVRERTEEGKKAERKGGRGWGWWGIICSV